MAQFLITSFWAPSAFYFEYTGLTCDNQSLQNSLVIHSWPVALHLVGRVKEVCYEGTSLEK